MDALIYKDTIYGGGGAMRGNYFNPIIYSTEEREVGVGENNKPLYQKTIESGSIPADSVVTTGLTNIETYHVVAIETISINDNAEFSPSSISMYNYQGAGTNYGLIYFNNNELQYLNNSRINAIKIRAVIQYTKTTDVAGSGQYTTLGVPAVHYDGNEKVVGTYFGKTLYEKSYIQQLSDGSASIDISDLNADYAFIENGSYDIGVTKLALNEIIDVNSRLYTYAHINTGSQYLNIDCKNTISATSTIHITIRYTKTS